MMLSLDGVTLDFSQVGVTIEWLDIADTLAGAPDDEQALFFARLGMQFTPDTRTEPDAWSAMYRQIIAMANSIKRLYPNDVEPLKEFLDLFVDELDMP